MSLWAIVPVKPLRLGKSRLAGVLSAEERAKLNHNLLEHTLQVLTQVPQIQHTLVVSRDPKALALARDYNVRTVREEGSPFLNKALRRATTFAQVYSPEGVLILPADLPLITAEDIQEMLNFSEEQPVVAIAPDRRNDGTNALLVCPAMLIEYSYGPGSFARHCDQARRAGAHLEICHNQHLALDLDLPEDFELMKKMMQETKV
jgi:2-phospho-L-lactate guanylyltransferase